MKKSVSLILVLALFISSLQLICVSAESDDENSVIISECSELKSALSCSSDSETIYLRGGRYCFPDTFEIAGIKRNITLCSAPGETAVLTSASKVEGWQECTINGVSALCASAGGETVTSLFSDGTELQKARFPETGFCCIDKADTSDTVGEGDSMGTNGIYVRNIDFSFESPEDILVSTVHWWLNELSPMASFDVSSGLIKTEKYSGMSNCDGDRYYLENVKECVDKPGEWCFDSSENKIYYVPENGETADNLCLYASSVAEMLKISNCSGITFKNIEFAETAFTYGDEKYLNTDIHIHGRTWKAASFQSAVDAPGAVTVTYSDNINFINCEFRNTGCTAVKYFDGAKNCRAENCLFDGIGASALFIGGKYSFYNADENNPENYAENITVTNCEICNYGLKFYGASGITLTYCDTAEISHNEIHDGYYTGISVGYCWLFFDNPTQYISVKDNLIYDIGNHMLSDLGGIYLLGVQEGTVVSGNVVHDVTCYDGDSGYAGCGIYLDSGCEFMTIEKNLVFNCDTTAYNNTLNKNNIVRNNIFSFSGQSVVSLGLADYGAFTDLNSSYSNNIILTDNNVTAVEYLKTDEHFCGSGNIIWDAENGDDVYFCINSYDSGKILKETAKLGGYIDSAVLADPGFNDASAYDFDLSDDSYAVTHGFEPIDYDNAGTVPGTTIGFNKAGGQTPYNQSNGRIKITNVKVKFTEKIKSVFYKIYELLKSLIAKITGTYGNPSGGNLYSKYYEKRTGNENTEKLEQLFDNVKEHIPSYRVDETRKPFNDDDRITAVYFDGEKYNGKDTEIFAYLGIPEDASALNPVPAVVLVHGGGVYAQADWVKYWVDRGYAAIAIDGFGEEPLQGEYVSDNSNWVHNPDSHMAYAGFDDCDKDLDEQWFYYFLTDIILANNILRADSRIAHNEIGVSGISWGGIATSVVMGYDERFAFAIPIYGCPYSADSSGGANTIFNEIAENIWEPSLRLDKVNMPVLFINGNTDPFFSPQCQTTAVAYLKNGSLIFKNELSHGKFSIEEAVRFANEVTGHGKGNIHITDIDINGNKVKISFTVPSDITGIRVTLYTRNCGFEYENFELTEGWKSKNCVTVGTTATVTIPAGTEYYYIAVSGTSFNGLDTYRCEASTGVFGC